MMQRIRDWTTGWLATVIVGLLIIPFAFWGIDSYFGGSEPIVAEVNDEKIRLAQFQRAYSNYRQQLQALINRNLDIEEDVIQRQALDRLIESRLLQQITRNAHMHVTNDQVLDTIRNIQAFQTEDGQFNRAFYEQAVMRLGMQPAMYENQMRQEMAAEQLQSAIIESVFVSEQEAGFAARLQNQTRDFRYAVIPASDIRERLEVSEEEITDYFENNKQLYAEPEKVRIAYIDLSMEKLAESVPVDEESLRDYYTQNKAQFDVEEQRKLEQLLIKKDDNDTQEAIEASREKAWAIRKAVAEGKSFQEITKTYTDDPDFSFTEYGYTKKGVLPDAVDEAVFNLELDGITDVIESEKGFHILKLVDMKGGVFNTFENNREAVDAAYRRSIAEEQFFDLADRLASAAFEHPDSLEIAAEETGMTIQTSDFFSRQGGEDEITASQKVIDASFAEETLEQGLNSEMLELSDTHLVVLRIREHRPGAVPPLADIREQVISDIKFNKAREQARDKGQAILSSLEQGDDYDRVASRENIEWQAAEAAKRDSVDVIRAVLREAFSLGGTGSDMPVYGGLTLGTGDYAVIVVEAIRIPAANELEEDAIEQVRTELQEARSAGAWRELIQQLRQEADVKIYEERI